MREKNSTSGEKRFLGQMSDMSGMPKDVTLGAPILTVTGQMELLVENYRGILEYTECLPDSDQNRPDPNFGNTSDDRILYQR